MDRRRFLQGIAVTTAGIGGVPLRAEIGEPAESNLQRAVTSSDRADINTEGHTLLCSFVLGTENWKVYEDLRTREGAIAFVSTKGGGRVLTKSAEACFAEVNPPYLGLNLKDIGMAGADLLADRLLRNGDPDPEEVKSAIPPHGSAALSYPGERTGWDTFVGTRECLDTMPVYPSGNTRTYHPVQYFPALNGELARRRFEGLLGGWLPAVRKVMPVSESEHYEVV
ncbi:MAG: Tat pathway signal protein, partial [Terriglobales bacterium]